MLLTHLVGLQTKISLVKDKKKKKKVCACVFMHQTTHDEEVAHKFATAFQQQ